MNVVQPGAAYRYCTSISNTDACAPLELRCIQVLFCGPTLRQATHDDTNGTETCTTSCQPLQIRGNTHLRLCSDAHRCPHRCSQVLLCISTLWQVTHTQHDSETTNQHNRCTS